MTCPSRALVDLSALRRNHQRGRKQHGGRTLAVVKADAYGHGAVACARALEHEADGFAVAFLDEALPLREAGIFAPLLVLEGCFGAAELATARRLGCWVVIHHEDQLRLLESPCRGTAAAGLAEAGQWHAARWLCIGAGARRPRPVGCMHRGGKHHSDDPLRPRQ